jgi:hypothetical protein
MILAPSGFGKTTSAGNIPELKIKGLNPETTFIISATSKPLPFKGSAKVYPIGKPTEKTARRYVSNNGDQIAAAIKYIVENRKEIKDIILDDSNYIMQDYYMANALRKGYDVFKEIGKFMDAIFTAMELSSTVNFIMMAHYEEFKDSSADTISYRYKTTGKMVNDYITPEGKFDIVLYGKQSFNDQDKIVTKQFVTNYDGQFPSKSPVGMFKDLYIPNDLGIVIETVNKYYN